MILLLFIVKVFLKFFLVFIFFGKGKIILIKEYNYLKYLVV